MFKHTHQLWAQGAFNFNIPRAMHVTFLKLGPTPEAMCMRRKPKLNMETQPEWKLLTYFLCLAHLGWVLPQTCLRFCIHGRNALHCSHARVQSSPTYLDKPRNEEARAIALPNSILVVLEEPPGEVPAHGSEGTVDNHKNSILRLYFILHVTTSKDKIIWLSVWRRQGQFFSAHCILF